MGRCDTLRPEHQRNRRVMLCRSGRKKAATLYIRKTRPSAQPSWMARPSWRLEVVPRWRGRGYGSYLLKELLRQNGGLDPKQATRFTAPLPRDAAGRALAQNMACPGRQPAGAPPRARPVRRAAPPCVFDRTARPRRAVRGCHLRQRPRHAVPVYAGRPGRARAGAGYSTAGR